jgi:hypothetical protein
MRQHMESGGSSGARPFDPEAAIQAAKYDALCELVDHAKARGQDLVLRRSKQIALYLYRDEREFKRVFGLIDFPIYRENSTLCMSVQAHEEYVALQLICAIYRLNFKDEARKRGLFEPKNKKK